MNAAAPRVIVALDFPDMLSAFGLAARLDPALCAVKVGKELFTVAEAGLVRELVRRGFRVFLDLKFHDIPNTVAGAVAAATRLGAWMINVHASGGAAMMKAARAAADEEAARASRPAPIVIAVTMLTSLNDAMLTEVGFAGGVTDQVERLARLAQTAGLDGVVASAQEIALIRRRCGSAFAIVTPGIRGAGDAVGDQSRTMSAAQALAAGSTYLVVGRPIIASADPRAAAERIGAEWRAADAP